MRTYWIPRANHEQRKLLENSMAFHTGCTVSE
jgi:hypothetical protein